MIVVDVQGVGDLYTDPQIHTAKADEYGDANLGKCYGYVEKIPIFHFFYIKINLDFEFESHFSPQFSDLKI